MGAADLAAAHRAAAELVSAVSDLTQHLAPGAQEATAASTGDLTEHSQPPVEFAEGLVQILAIGRTFSSVRSPKMV